MAELAERSATGHLTTFNGIFQVQELSSLEKLALRELLASTASKNSLIDEDLEKLILITQEVKAINHQAALLHGERIKRAHLLLANYKEGAFSKWLIGTYGNRQTPYNLMQYYDFYQAIPSTLKKTIEEMPRQAIYSLASRSAPLPEKIAFIKEYKGESKGALLIKLRDLFPLETKDKRKENRGDLLIGHLRRAVQLLERKGFTLSARQKDEAVLLLKAIEKEVKITR